MFFVKNILEQTAVRLLICCLLLQMALSYPLWAFRAVGAVPAVPLWGEAFFPEQGLWWMTGWLPGLLAVAALCFPEHKFVLGALVASLACSVLFDLNRLQPWVYWYALAFGALAWDRADKTPLALLIGAVYVWGGLHKITPWFAEDNFSWFCGAFAITKPFGLPELGYVAAIAEALLGPLLWWPKTRQTGVWAAMMMHVWIMLVLSPMGLGWNTVVLPWNAAMMIAVWYVFSAKDHFSVKNESFTTKMWVGWLLLSPLIPGLPRVFGWHLYNNTQPEATFVCGAQKPYCVSDWDQMAYDDGQRLLLDDWAVRSLGVPLFHSDLTFQKLQRYLQRCGVENGYLEVMEVTWWQK
jgi:hypothetical protein